MIRKTYRLHEGTAHQGSNESFLMVEVGDTPRVGGDPSITIQITDGDPENSHLDPALTLGRSEMAELAQIVDEIQKECFPDRGFDDD